MRGIERGRHNCEYYSFISKPCTSRKSIDLYNSVIVLFVLPDFKKEHNIQECCLGNLSKNPLKIKGRHFLGTTYYLTFRLSNYSSERKCVLSFYILIYSYLFHKMFMETVPCLWEDLGCKV